MKPFYETNDNVFSYSAFDLRRWHLDVIQAPAAWDYTQGATEVKIGVIDFGIDTAHTDLNFMTTTSYTGKKDDGMGNSHGTHVAGLIGSKNNNGTGGASVGFNNMIYNFCPPTIFLNTTPKIDDFVSAITAAITTGVDVINMSFGFTRLATSLDFDEDVPPATVNSWISRGAEVPTTMPSAVTTALNSALSNGIILVAAAGNRTGNSGSEFYNFNPEDDPWPDLPYTTYPAAYTGVIAVSGTKYESGIESFYTGSVAAKSGSNFGNIIDFSAPGKDIYSTKKYTSPLVFYGTGADYQYMSGTSQAAPIVTSLIGYLLSINNSLTRDQIITILTNSCDDMGSVGWDQYYGNGRINAKKAGKYLIEHHGGTFAQDLVIPSGEVFDIQAGITLKFASGKKLIVNGTLNATNATFTGSTTSSTWGGIVFQPGSSGNLNGCNINHVCVYGAGAITINGSSPTIQYCTIENNNTGTTYGVSILNNANPYLHHNTISANSSHAVYISNANGKFQYNNIYGTTGNYCLYANDAAPIFSYSIPTPYYEGKNLLRNGQYGIYATSGSNVSAGFTQWAQNNSIHTNSSYNVVAQSNSIVSAVNNWWNTTVQSQITSKLNADGTSTIYYSPFRTSAPSAMMKSGEDYSDPGLVSEKLYEAIELRLSGRENESLEILKEIIEKAPETKEAILALNEIGRLQSSDRISSVEDFIRQVTLSTKSNDKIKTTSELLLAKILSKQGKMKSAIEINNRVILKEKGTEYELTAGLRNFFIYYNSGDIKNAEQELKNLKSGYKDNENLIAVEWMLGVENNFSQNQDKEDLPESKQEEEMLSEKIQLLGNYPNPFNPTTEIKFSVPVTSNVKLTIYNIMGQEIKSFESDGVSVGTHSFNWNGTNVNNEQVASGIYIYRLRAIGNNGQVFEKSAKMMLLK